MRKRLLILFLMLSLMAAMTGCSSPKAEDKTVMRVAHFPNITHAQALIGLADGSFQQLLGSQVKIERKCFNAGPEEIEALLAGEIDLGYIGPVPAINGYIKSNGGLKIIGGCANGGAVLVTRDKAVSAVKDLNGMKIAVPQFGNTQDISLRKLLSDQGLKTVNQGGKITVLQVKNPDILLLFQRKQLEAALVPEPWGARLEIDGGGKILLDQDKIWRNGNYSTAVLVVRENFLQQHPDLVAKWVEAHVLVTEKIKQDEKRAMAILNEQLKELSGKNLPEAVLSRAFKRINLTYDPAAESVREFAVLAYEAGYLKEKPDVSRIFALDYLNKALGKNKLPLIKP